MKKYLNRILSIALVLVLSLGIAVPAMATYDGYPNLSFSATLDTPTLTESDSDQFVTVTLAPSQAIQTGSITYGIDVPAELELQSITSDVFTDIGSFSSVSNKSVNWFTMGADYTDVNELGIFEIKVPAGTDPGQYTITISGIELTYNADPYPAQKGTASATLTINPAPVVIDSFNLGVTAPVSGATPDSGAVMNQWSSSISWTPADATFQSGKAYTANVTMTAADGYKFSAANYASYMLSQGINVNSCSNVSLSGDGKTLTFSYTYPEVPKPTITITEDDITIADAGKYTGSAKEPAVTVDGLSTGDYVVSYSNNTNAGTGASVTVSPAPNGRYIFTPVTKNFAIAKADQTISASDVTVVVGAGEVSFDFRAEGDISIRVDGTVPSGTTVDAQAKKMTVGNVAGSFKLVLTTEGNQNYGRAEKTITVTISEKAKADVSISDAPASKTYGDAAFTLTASAANTGSNGAWTWTSDNTDVLTVDNTGKVTIVGAGSATITAKYESATTIGSATTAVITVNKAKLTVKANDQGIKVNEALPGLDIDDCSVTGLVNGDTLEEIGLTVNVAYADNTNASVAGTYAIVVSGAAETDNYIVTYVEGSLIVSDDPNFVWIPIIGFDTNPFKDVDEKDYYYDAVQWAVKKNITNGITEDTFVPDMICTRAQMVTFLWRAAGCPAPNSTKMPFSDVPANAYYYDAVLWAVENGITNGTSATTFSPNATVTRAQSVTFLWRMCGEPEAKGPKPFVDVAENAYYYEAVLWAMQVGITNGTSDTTFSPNAGCTRAQIVTFLWRCF